MQKVKQFLAPYKNLEDLPRKNKLKVFCVICKTFVPLAGNRKLTNCTNPICNGEIDDLYIAEMGTYSTLKSKRTHGKGSTANNA